MTVSKIKKGFLVVKSYINELPSINRKSLFLYENEKGEFCLSVERSQTGIALGVRYFENEASVDKFIEQNTNENDIVGNDAQFALDLIRALGGDEV